MGSTAQCTEGQSVVGFRADGQTNGHLRLQIVSNFTQILEGKHGSSSAMGPKSPGDGEDSGESRGLDGSTRWTVHFKQSLSHLEPDPNVMIEVFSLLNDYLPIFTFSW